MNATTHPVVTGRWLARTPDGATWDGYRVGYLSAGDVITYAGPARDYAETRLSVVDELEMSGRVVFWHGKHTAPDGSTETHWNADAHAAGHDWRLTVTRGNHETYAAPGYAWRLETHPAGNLAARGTADTLHGAMTAIVDTLADVHTYAPE